MQWLTLFLALYGAALSSALGYLALRRDRHSLRFFVSYKHMPGEWYGMVVSVVNVGFRPVIVESIAFETTESWGYLNGPIKDEPELPARLEEGEQIVFFFHAEDIEPATSSFVVTDTHRRRHRMPFTTETWDSLSGFRAFIEEGEPALAAKGRERAARLMRDMRASDPKPDDAEQRDFRE